MKNQLTDLNNYLFEQIEKLNDESIPEEDFEKTLKQASAIRDVAETIIKNGELALKTTSLALQYGYVKSDDVPKMLLGVNKNNG